MTGVPEVLVSLDAPAGAVDERTDDARRADTAIAAGASAVLLRPSASVDAMLAKLPPHVAAVAVLPDMPQLLRDVAERGAPRAALARLRRGGIAAGIGLALTGFGHLPALARQDFAGILPVLMQLERAGLGRVPLSAVVLASSLTDLLLAARHRECLAHLVLFVRRHVSPRMGFETANLGHLLPRLDAWGIEPDFVIGPMNRSGFRMKPSRIAALEAVRRSRVPVIASEVSARGAVALADGIAFARSHGAAGVVVTIDEIATAGGLPS